MENAINLVRHLTAMIALIVCIYPLFSLNVHAGEWKTCIVGNATVNNRDVFPQIQS